VPGNERTDGLPSSARVCQRPPPLPTSNSRSQRFRAKKDAWHKNPANHGTLEIPPPPPKKSCLDKVRNTIARTVAQICTGHWRSAEYLKRIRKGADDKCWFCQGRSRMTGRMSCFPRLAAARVEAWEGRNPGSAHVLLSNPRWGEAADEIPRVVGVGRTMADGTDEGGARAEKMDGSLVSLMRVRIQRPLETSKVPRRDFSPCRGSNAPLRAFTHKRNQHQPLHWSSNRTTASWPSNGAA